MLNSLIDTQTRLRDAAEARWEAARVILFKLASLVAADWIERKQHEKGGLNVIRIEELAEVISQRVSALEALSKLPEAGKLEKTNQRIEELSRERGELLRQQEKMVHENEEYQAEIQKLQNESKSLAAENEKLKSSLTTGEIASGTFPVLPWFYKWASRSTFERQSFVIRLMGETGLARRNEIIKAFIEKFGGEKTDGSISNLLKRLEEKGFITSEKTAGTGHGAPVDILTLAPLGETAYLYLAQKPPVENEYHSIRSAHSTDAHIVIQKSFFQR